MLDNRHLLQAIEAAGADGNVVYVSVPITSGRRELALLGETGLFSTEDFRAAHRDRWIAEVVRPNEEEARKHAAAVRAAPWADDRIVVDPSRMQVDGWDQDDYNAFWVELLARHVEILVAAPGWQYSRGARGEVGYAVALGRRIVTVEGERLDREELLREASTAHEALVASGWAPKVAEAYLPPLDVEGPPDHRPSPQRQVFSWLGEARRRRIAAGDARRDHYAGGAEGTVGAGGWAATLRPAWERGASAGLDSVEGRAALGELVVEACALLESAVRAHGPLPSPADDGGGHG
jgi:hypothetical protein